MNPELESLIIQDRDSVPDDLIRQFAYSFAHQFVGFRQLGSRKVTGYACGSLRRRSKMIRPSMSPLSSIIAATPLKR